MQFRRWQIIISISTLAPCGLPIIDKQAAAQMISEGYMVFISVILSRLFSG